MKKQASEHLTPVEYLQRMARGMRQKLSQRCRFCAAGESCDTCQGTGLVWVTKKARSDYYGALDAIETLKAMA